MYAPPNALTIGCTLLVVSAVLRVTYKKTRRVTTKVDDDVDEAGDIRTIVRVVVRQVFDHPRREGDLANTGVSTAPAHLAVDRRITLWTSASDCEAPFCAGSGSSRRPPTFDRGKDYLVMGHVDRPTGRLLLDRRSVVEYWKPRWPAQIQV